MTYADSSGTGANISCSSRSISSSDFVLRSSSSVRGGSHDAMRRWLFARATLARLKIMSASFVVVGAGMVKFIVDLVPVFVTSYHLVVPARLWSGWSSAPTSASPTTPTSWLLIREELPSYSNNLFLPGNCLSLPVIMFRLARSRPLTAALRAATVDQILSFDSGRQLTLYTGHLP